MELRVFDRYEGELLLAIGRKPEGGLEVLFVVPDLQAAIDSWFEHGIHEWVGSREDAYPRTTLPTDSDFLPRLAVHIQVQTGTFLFQLTGGVTGWNA